MTSTPDVEKIGLPPDLAEAFRKAGGLDECPDTLGQGFSAVTDLLHEAGVTVSLEDMYQPTLTRHAVNAGDLTEHVPCVMDALIVALRLDSDSVEICSEPPGGGEPVQFHITGDEVTVTPTSTVVSFGLGLEESTDPDLDSLNDSLNDPEAPIPTTCSVTNAFPDARAYEQWAAEVSDAAVMQLSVEGMVALSERALQSHITD